VLAVGERKKICQKFVKKFTKGLYKVVQKMEKIKILKLVGKGGDL
jgi:hypothetical protein